MKMIEVENNGKTDFDLQSYWYLILARKWHFIGLAVLGFMVVTMYFNFQGPTYVTSAEISVESPILRRGISIEEIAERRVEIKTREAHLTSQKLLREVIANLDLMERTGSTSEDELIRGLQGSIAVYEGERKSNVLTIEVMGQDPQLITDIANSIADTYVKQDAEDTLYISKKLDEWIQLDKKVGKTDYLRPTERETIQAIESIPSVLKDDLLRSLKEQRIQVMTKIRAFSEHYLEKYPPLAFLNKEQVAIDTQIWERTRAVLQSIKSGAEEGLIPTTIRVLNYALLPKAPNTSTRVKKTLFAVVFPALALFVFLVVKRFMDRTIKTHEDISHVPFLGYLPASEEDMDLKTLPYKTREASGLIRTSINFAMSNENEKVIMLTSPLPAEGKTTVASIVATAMARAGKKTVLVNGDLRRPRLSKMFGFSPDLPGLADYLNGNKGRGAITVSTFKDNLDLIPSGEPCEESSDLLSTDRIRNLLDELREKYDKVIIDAPPVMGISDSLLISKHVDSVVMVTRFSQTNRAVFDHAMNQLRNTGTPVIGVVINGFDSEKMKNSPYKYYTDYYSYNLMQTNGSSQN